MPEEVDMSDKIIDTAIKAAVEGVNLLKRSQGIVEDAFEAEVAGERGL